MADTGKQTPLGMNVLGSFLRDIGLNINPIVEEYIGVSKTNTDYSFGKIISDTCLLKLTWAINDAYLRGSLGGGASGGPTYTNDLYDQLLLIAGDIPALGNSLSPNFILTDPAEWWSGSTNPNGSMSKKTETNAPANTGYALSGISNGNGQTAKWRPWGSANSSNHSVTQWGFFRLNALQAWNQFNYNGGGAGDSAKTPYPTKPHPEYKEFLASFMQACSFLEYTNAAIYANYESFRFLKGTYSNMNDLMTGDVFNVNIASKAFGNDLMALGKSLDLLTISSFGLPSNLLRTLYKNNIITTDLILALNAAGVVQSQIVAITTGEVKKLETNVEKAIYGAFLIIIDQNLQQILNGLNCSTPNLTSLADLLNVKKMFPTSFGSLTVPIYNTTTGPTNSKTFYLLFTNGGVNSQLSSTQVKEKVGFLTLPGQPVPEEIEIVDKEVVISDLIPGFDSYLRNILPTDLAITAGAFSYSMQQIKNIDKMDIEKFGQVVYSLEGNNGLELTNTGTELPTNQIEAFFGTNYMALGSGPFGTYTVSDFFGCMSALPYPHKDTYDAIKQLETTKLFNIYDQLYLATQWERAEIVVTQTDIQVVKQNYVPAVPATPTKPGVPAKPLIVDWYYTCTYTATADGGGYGRGGAAPPPVTLSPNNCRATISSYFLGDSLGSAGAGTYGRVGFKINNGGQFYYGTSTDFSTTPTKPTRPVETVLVYGPPIESLPVTDQGKATNGVNINNANNYWPSTMGSVCQNYIAQANSEVGNIYKKNTKKADWLNINYLIYGSQLAVEQRARFLGLGSVPIVDTNKKDVFLNSYPGTIINFVDSVPTYAKNTLPHMHVQTLEAIANIKTVGGQSLIAMMREARNQIRLNILGTDLYNNIPAVLEGISLADYQKLLLNGTAPIARAGSGVFVKDCATTWTLPSWTSTNSALTPKGSYVYDPGQGGLILGTGAGIVGTNLTFLNGDCETKVILPIVPSGPYLLPEDIIQNVVTPVINTTTFIFDTKYKGNLQIDLATGNTVQFDFSKVNDVTDIVTNNITKELPITIDRTIVDPNVIDGNITTFTSGNVNIITGNPRDRTPFNTGNITGNSRNRTTFNTGTLTSFIPKTRGSLGNTTLVVPTLLDLTFTSSTITNSTVDDAIAQVIECNCDCWLI